MSHPISEMAMHQQFLNHLAGTDASLFGIDPTLLPSHLAGYHGENDGDEGDGDEGDENDGPDGADGEVGDRDADRDIPTPPFFSGDLPPGATEASRGVRVRQGSKSGLDPSSSSSASAAANANGRGISRLPDPRAQALMQLVPMPSQLPPGASPTDPNGNPLPSPITPIPTPGQAVPTWETFRYGSMAPHPVGLPGLNGVPPNVGISNSNPADQVGTWTESVNAYWQPMGLPAFQAPVLVSGGLAATIRDARLAWMVGESVCGHPSCLGRRFERKTNLLKHLLTHVEARPYVCQIPGCDQAFKQKWLLDRHGRVHMTNKEVHKCPVPGCNTTCSSLYNLRNHELVHSETKKFLCEFENCGRTFATARNLRLHQRTHTGDKPFACDFPGCGMRYHRPAHLKRHQEVHNENAPRKARASERGPQQPRRRKGAASEIENEIDELAGDGESYTARNAPEEEPSQAPGIASRARPRRAAAVAAVAANRSKRWDEDIDFGDEEHEEEDDEDDEDEAGEDGDIMMDEDDDDDEMDESYRARPPHGNAGRARGRPSVRGRAPPIISSSGGPPYGTSAPFSNTRTTSAQSNDANEEHMIDPELRGPDGEEDGGNANTGVAPAAEGNEDGDEELDDDDNQHYPTEHFVH